MKLASVLTPLSDANLQLARQAGVTDIVVRFPGPDLADLVAVQERLASFDLRIPVLEGGLPIEHIKRGNAQRDADIDAMCQLIENMKAAGIPIICYNFMAGTDWVRTSTTIPDRGGAWVTGFDAGQVKQAVSLDKDKQALDTEEIDGEQLWDNLAYFLERVVPVAETAGIVLAMHPDDPPVPRLLGRARIMNSVEGFERLVSLVPSPSNAICFCQGTFAAMGVDIPATIRRLGRHIRYVHFRDVRGTAESFVETFHDNGPTDMAAAIRAYRDVGFDGPIRPDHVPQMVGEEDGEPGYTILGRLFAYGYIRGLLDATA